MIKIRLKEFTMFNRVTLVFLTTIYLMALFAQNGEPNYEVSISVDKNQVTVTTGSMITATISVYSHQPVQSDITVEFTFDNRYLRLIDVQPSRGQWAFGNTRISAWEGYPVLIVATFQLHAPFAGIYGTRIIATAIGPSGTAKDSSEAIIIDQPKTRIYLPH
jgi:hypothetical protein